MPARLLVTVRALQNEMDQFEKELRDAGVTWSCPPTSQHFSADEMLRLLKDCDVAIVGDDVINEGVLRANTHVRRIVKWGVGMDAIDLLAANRLGVDVINSPDALPPVVAEGAIGYLLALARNLAAMDAGVREGRWPKPRGFSLSGKTIGIIGMGRIGQEIAVRAQGMRMRVMATDVRQDASIRLDDGTTVGATPLPELLAQADVVCLACNLTPANRHMLNARTIEMMKHGAIVVNVARGPLIETQALVKALRTGRIGGAALDVFEEEPLPPNHALSALPNVFLGSHNIQNTKECVSATNARTIALALAALAAEAQPSARVPIEGNASPAQPAQTRRGQP